MSWPLQTKMNQITYDTKSSYSEDKSYNLSLKRRDMH
jgi:hypothetical protein